MPRSKQHKAQSRERILASAYRLFAQQGFEHVSIDAVMADAGMTRGAFYAHFTHKAELYSEAIQHAAQSRKAAMSNACLNDQDCIVSAVDRYLSLDHIVDENTPCPLAFLVSDVALREPMVRASYHRVYLDLVKMISQKLATLEIDDRQKHAQALTALLVGGVAIARALNSQNDAEQLLDSCREMVYTLIDHETRVVEPQ